MLLTRVLLPFTALCLGSIAVWALQEWFRECDDNLSNEGSKDDGGTQGEDD